MKLKWIPIFMVCTATFQAEAADPSVHLASVTYGNPALSQIQVLSGTDEVYEGQFIFCDSSGDCDVFGLPRTIDGTRSLLVSRLDAAGKLLWARTYDSGNAYLDQVIRSADGGSLLAIDTRSGFGGPPVQRGRGLILKLSPDGKPIWATLISAPNGKDTVARVGSMAQAPDGSLIVTGECIKGELDDESHDVAVLKLTSTGKRLWSHCYRFEHQSFGERVQIRADGSIALIVTFMIGDKFDSDSVLFTVSTDGTPLHAGQFAVDEGTFQSIDLFARADGGLVVAGGLSTKRTEWQDRGAFLRLDVDGTVKAARSYEVTGDFQPYESVSLPGGIALLGASELIRKGDSELGSAVTLLVDEDGQLKAAVVATAPGRRPDQENYSDFQGIAPLPDGHYRLVGATTAFKERWVDLLTAIWSPAPDSGSDVVVKPLQAKLVPVPLPKAYEGNISIDALDISRIEVVDVKQKN